MTQIKMTADAGSVHAALTKQVQEFGRIETASRAVARAEREREAATRSASRAHNAPSGSRQTAMIGRLLGGEGGRAISHGAHFAHLTGGFLAAGAAAIGVSLAFKAITAASAQAVEAAKEEAKVRIELKNAIRQATKAADATAIGAYKSDSEAINTLAATGGDSAVERAKRLTRFGPDAIKGAGALAAKGQFSDSNVDAAIEATKSGRITFQQAAEMIAGGNVSARGSSHARGAQILSAHLNQAVSGDDLTRFQANFKGSVYGERGTALAGQEGDKVNASLDRFKGSGTLFDQGAKDINAIRDPAEHARSEIAYKLDEQIDIQRAGVKAQYSMVAALETLVGLFGGGGSELDKIVRMHAARAVVN